MGKMKELSEILGELADAVTELGRFLASSEEEETAAAESEPTPSKEDVRKILAGWMTRDEGRHKPQVRDLLRKYSEAGNLSGVNPEDYRALLAELEAMEDAA